MQRAAAALPHHPSTMLHRVGAALVLLALLCSSAGASVTCVWSKASPGGAEHLSFVHAPASSAPPRLYHGSWTAAGRALSGCTWSDDAALVAGYVSACRHQPRLFSQPPDARVKELLHAGSACSSLEEPPPAMRAPRRPARSITGRDESEGHGGRSEVEIHRRTKRGFIVPGTLWCGSGNKAPSYGDLGVFSQTDSCCREHDQCKDTILSFHSQFGVFNSNIFTMSHCDCDHKFRSCLKEAGDQISEVVGYTFFSLLKMHCFRFSHRLQCTQRNWFGMCKESKMSLYAEVFPPDIYESPAAGNGSLNASSLDASSLIASSPSAPVTTVTASTGPTPPTPEQQTAPTPPDVASQCHLYKDLDQCKDKIPPQHTKYGFHNAEAATVYHCNCTARLFQALEKQRQLTEVQSVLLGSVSASCFLPQDCTAGKTCEPAVVLLRGQLPEPERGAEVEERRPLQALRLRLRSGRAGGVRRRGGGGGGGGMQRAGRLSRMCERITMLRLNKY